MHERLWAGVARKLQDAQLSFDEMARSLQPPEHTTLNVVLESAGKIIDTRWQDSFYGFASVGAHHGPRREAGGASTLMQQVPPRSRGRHEA
jgi:hypothetical protein